MGIAYFVPRRYLFIKLSGGFKVLHASGWHIGQSHMTKKFTVHRFFTDKHGRNHAAPLLDAESGKAALFDTPDLALASATVFDQQVATA